MSQNSHLQPFVVIFMCREYIFRNRRDFLHENTSTLYFTILVPRKSQANLKTSPNWPKFLIDDVIPEVALIFRWRDPFFWTQRSILHKNTSIWLFLCGFLNCNFRSYIMPFASKIDPKCIAAPRWRHKAHTPSTTLQFAFLRPSGILNFEQPELSQKLIFFDPVFFVWKLWLDSIWWYLPLGRLKNMSVPL